MGHGKGLEEYPSLWSAQEHLLLAAHIFPLLVKHQLAKAGKRPLTDDEQDELSGVDHLLSAQNVLAADEVHDGHPVNYQWQRFLRHGVNEARMARVISQLKGPEPR